MIGYFVIGLAIAYGIWIDIRSKKRKAAGMCVRCGQRPGVSLPNGVPDNMIMCEPCVATTERNHRVALYFFVGLGVLGFILVSIGLAHDAKNGCSVSWRDLWIYGPVAGSPSLMALLVWFKIKKVKGAGPISSVRDLNQDK